MLIGASLDQQLRRQSEDRLRVLVVGAGVAGLTLAQLLRRGGLQAALAERAVDMNDAGYMLALMPLVDPAMRGLDVQAEYHSRSEPFRRYRLYGHRGQLLREYEMGTLLESYGDYRGISRGNLLEVLSAKDAAVSFGVTTKTISQSPKGVKVALQTGGETVEAEFDAVVLADGMHSEGRAMLLEPQQVSTYDTDWGGWVAWIETEPGHADLGAEIWGAGFFVGVYPVMGRAGVFVGGNRADMDAGPAAFVKRIRSQLREIDPWLDRVLARIVAGHDLYFWKLTDCRSDIWTVGRVVLLGDAAAGFLPTAGIGAGMAMESANVLACNLLEARPDSVSEALRAYETTQRPRVESAQENSRQLAKMMFHQSVLLAIVRDIAGRLLPLRMALRPIIKLLEEAPQISAS